MAKNQSIIPQNYPRISDPNDSYYGCLDDTKLVSHTIKIPEDKMKELILLAIKNANKKSSREILSIPQNATNEEIEKICVKEGKELFKYFKKYCGDPASTAHQVYQKHYSDIAREQFRNRTLQKERMNSGWRYQYLVIDCARETKRFKSISDIGASEGDFNAIIHFIDKTQSPLNLYVSVKNRSNTMGGQDWPKAIKALETLAANDKNKVGPYCCIFGMAMDRGTRHIKRRANDSVAHSINTEVWLSDYFWPFFANSNYEEIMTLVLKVLLSSQSTNKSSAEIDIPEELVVSFGECCKQADLLDETGNFNDPFKLVKFFCATESKSKKNRKVK